MIPITSTISLNEEALSITFVRATGPGGQNVNKLATAAQLRCDTRTQHWPEDMQARLATLAGSRMTREGVIVIFADRFRTQERNREDAMERLMTMLRQAAVRPRRRIATRPTKASKERRLTAKSVRSSVKAGRQGRGFSD